VNFGERDKSSRRTWKVKGLTRVGLGFDQELTKNG
jgi:hypothetical protein